MSWDHIKTKKGAQKIEIKMGMKKEKIFLDKFMSFLRV